MWAYWLLFLVPAGISISPIKADKHLRYFAWIMVGLLCVFIIGLRFEVGTDWFNYVTYFEKTQKLGLSEAVLLGNANGPAYFILSWILAKIGLGIVSLNLICSILFAVGLIKYCRKQPFPWVALAVAVPYVICVVAMGYNRQGVALGFVFWALSILQPGNGRRFFYLIIIASLFHLSAILMLPLLFCIQPRIKLRHYFALGVFGAAVIALLIILDVVNNLQMIYEYTMSLESPGGQIRVYMNVLPVLASFFFLRQLKEISPDYRILKWMALACLICIPLLSFISSTMIDRLAVYLLPVQVAIFPRLIAVQKQMLSRSIVALLIVFYYGAILSFWFNNANNAPNWLPYKLWFFA